MLNYEKKYLKYKKKYIKLKNYMIGGDDHLITKEELLADHIILNKFNKCNIGPGFSDIYHIGSVDITTWYYKESYVVPSLIIHQIIYIFDDEKRIDYFKRSYFYNWCYPVLHLLKKKRDLIIQDVIDENFYNDMFKMMVNKMNPKYFNLVIIFYYLKIIDEASEIFTGDKLMYYIDNYSELNKELGTLIINIGKFSFDFYIFNIITNLFNIKKNKNKPLKDEIIIKPIDDLIEKYYSNEKLYNLVHHLINYFNVELYEYFKKKITTTSINLTEFTEKLILNFNNDSKLTIPNYNHYDLEFK